MFDKGDMNCAKQLQDEFRSGQGSNGRGRTQRASSRPPTSDRPRTQSDRDAHAAPNPHNLHQSALRGDHHFQCRGGASAHNNRNAPVPSTNKSRNSNTRTVTNPQAEDWWRPFGTLSSEVTNSTTRNSTSQPSNMKYHATDVQVNLHSPSTVLQAPMSDATNRQSPSKRPASDEKRNEDPKRARSGISTFNQSTETMHTSGPADSSGSDSDDLIGFSESRRPYGQTTITPATDAAHSTNIIDQDDEMMQDAWPSLTSHQRPRAGGLSASRWNRSSKQSHGQNLGDYPRPPDHEPSMGAAFPSGETIRSGMSTGRGLGDSRWAHRRV